MKKNSLLNIFIRRFIRTFFVMLLLVLVGFCSYKLTMLYYQVTGSPTETSIDSVINDLVNNVEIDDVSINLIYSVDEDASTIDNILIEIFNTDTGNLDYITLPAITQFTISNDMYQKLCASNSEIPQIIKLSELYNYFDKSNVYNYGVVLIEDLLDIDISYYTVINTDDFETMFEPTTKSVAYTNEDLEITVLKYTDTYRSKLSRLTSKDNIKDYITDLYKTLDSNLTIKNKLKYLDNYELINKDFIYFNGVYGEENNSSFTVDTEATNKLIKAILSNEAYTTKQGEADSISSNASSSVGLNIQILNGSEIAGLAAKYKEKLTLSGYTIVSVDNYPDKVLTKSKIITQTEGTGLDLLNNFKDADVETGELPEGIDIRIILGTADDITK